MHRLARLLGGALLALGLAGCVDATIEVEIVSETTARGTMTASFDRALIEEASAEGFCGAESKTTVTETEIICTEIEEGPFQTLSLGGADNDETVRIEFLGPGVFRIAFPLEGLKQSFADMSGDSVDEEERAGVEAMFAGRAYTLRVRGKVLETNMETAPDGMSAELSIPLLEGIMGKLELPDEAYAVVEH